MDYFDDDETKENDSDDSFDDDETKENDSDDEQHGFKILQCYCKAKKSCYKILRTLRRRNLRFVLLKNMRKYRDLRQRFPTNDVYKKMNSLVIKLINLKLRNLIEAMEALLRRKIAEFDSKMSEINRRLNRYVDSSACTDMTSSINNTYNINYESSTPQRFTL